MSAFAEKAAAELGASRPISRAGLRRPRKWHDYFSFERATEANCFGI